MAYIKSGTIRSTVIEGYTAGSAGYNHVNERYGLAVEWKQIENSRDIEFNTFVEFKMNDSELWYGSAAPGSITIGTQTYAIALPGAHYGPNTITTYSVAALKKLSFPAADSVPLSGVIQFNNLDLYLSYRLNDLSFAAGTTIPWVNYATPGVPTSVALTVSGGTASLTWVHSGTGGGQAYHYDIERSANGGTSWVSAATGHTAKSFSQTVAEGNYIYRVRAMNVAGISGFVNSNAAGMIEPVTPTMGAVSVSGTSATINWSTSTSAAQPVDSFTLQRSTNGGAWANVSTTIASTTRSYADNSLSRGSTYKYRVIAVNQVGTATSGEGSASIPYLIPNTPSLSSTQSGTSVSLTWSVVAHADRPINKFRLERRVNSGAWTLLVSPGAAATTYTNSSLSRGSTYEYRIYAEGVAGDSGASNTTSQAIPYLAPNTPSLTSSQSGTTADLSWTITVDAANRPISSFRLERQTNGGSWSAVAATIASGDRSYANTSLTRGNTYTYRLRADGSGGSSSWSADTTQRIPFLAPYKPASVTVARDAHDKFTVSWSQATDADRPVTGFDIYKKTENGSFIKTASVVLSARSFEDTAIALGAIYQYYIIAKNLDGSTQSDNSNSLTNPAGVPVWNGSAFVIRPVYVFNGSSWVHRPVYAYNGSTWHWRG